MVLVQVMTAVSLTVQDGKYLQVLLMGKQKLGILHGTQ
jgi:hypothetical protein